MTNIGRLEGRVREFINSHRLQSKLLSNPADWHKLCSALDLIGDTEYAIEDYPKNLAHNSIGSCYLIIYGILQALLLQQDAVKHLANALGIDVKFPRELNDIRIIRNSAAGHPILQTENKISKSCFITRMTLTPKSFEMMTLFSSGEDHRFDTIQIPELLEIQRNYLAGVLESVVSELEEQEMSHRKEYQDKKLVDCFHSGLTYDFSKLYEASNSGMMFELGLVHLGSISDCLESYRNMLEERGEWGNDAISYHYDLVEYPLEQLTCFFSNSDDNKLDSRDAYIFVSFIKEQINSLKEIAVEIDEDYEVD